MLDAHALVHAMGQPVGWRPLMNPDHTDPALARHSILAYASALVGVLAQLGLLCRRPPAFGYRARVGR